MTIKNNQTVTSTARRVLKKTLYFVCQLRVHPNLILLNERDEEENKKMPPFIIAFDMIVILA